MLWKQILNEKKRNKNVSLAMFFFVAKQKLPLNKKRKRKKRQEKIGQNFKLLPGIRTVSGKKQHLYVAIWVRMTLSAK